MCTHKPHSQHEMYQAAAWCWDLLRHLWYTCQHEMYQAPAWCWDLLRHLWYTCQHEMYQAPAWCWDLLRHLWYTCQHEMYQAPAWCWDLLHHLWYTCQHAMLNIFVCNMYVYIINCQSQTGTVQLWPQPFLYQCCLLEFIAQVSVPLRHIDHDMCSLID